MSRNPLPTLKLGVLLLQDFQKIKCTVELLDQALTEIKTQVPGIAKHQQQQVCHWNLVRKVFFFVLFICQINTFCENLLPPIEGIRWSKQLLS